MVRENALHRWITTNLELQSSVLISRTEFLYQSAPREVTSESQARHGSHGITFSSCLTQPPVGQTSAASPSAPAWPSLQGLRPQQNHCSSELLKPAGLLNNAVWCCPLQLERIRLWKGRSSGNRAGFCSLCAVSDAAVYLRGQWRMQISCESPWKGEMPLLFSTQAAPQHFQGHTNPSASFYHEQDLLSKNGNVVLASGWLLLREIPLCSSQKASFLN